MTAPIIPAGAADLADRLLVWRSVINGKLTGGVKLKTGDTSRSSSNTGSTYVADPHLVIPVAANTNYVIEAKGVYQAGATGSLKFQMSFPSGATMEGGSWEYDPGTDEWAATVMALTSPASFVVGLVGTGANLPFRLNGALFVGANAGNLTLDWAQNVTNATATILRKGCSLSAVATT